MQTRNCNNCWSVIGEWDPTNKTYISIQYCNVKTNKKCNAAIDLNCMKCDNQVGMVFFNVCVNCFGSDPILKKKNLKKFISKYEKTIYLYCSGFDRQCRICNGKNFKSQYLFFKKSTYIELK